MRKNDMIFCGIVCIFALMLCLVYGINKKSGNVAMIISDGKEIVRLSLNENTIFETDKNKIEIKDGKVFMSYAECPDKICIKQGKISNVGQTIVCLPNRMTVRIEN